MASGASKPFLGLRHLLKLHANLEESKRQHGELSQNFATFGTHYAIIKYWLGEEWTDRHLSPDSRGQSLYRMAFGRGSPLAELQVLRMRSIAENLFNLQYVEGFQDLIQQIKNKEAEPSLAELQVGRLLYINDVDFKFVAPTGTAGADYDLEIRVPGYTICGETKCKISSTNLSVKSLANDLRKAAKQLPRDRPGIVFLHFPPHWLEGPDPYTAEQRTVAAATAALRAVSRIVSVILYTAPLAHDGTMATEGDVFKEVPNPAHRFPRSPHYRLLRYRPSGRHWDSMPAKWIRLLNLPFGGLGEYRHEEE
jgi:hypothetical protein